MDYLKEFESYINNDNYIEAASVYIDHAYRYQKQFNGILEKTGCKTSVFDLIDFLMYGGNHWIDPTGGSHRTDDTDPSTMYK